MRHEPRTLPTPPEYPQLAAIGGPARLASELSPRLGGAFAEGALRIGTCAIERIDYKPGASGHCWLQLRARVEDGKGKPTGEQLLQAQIWPDEGFPAQARRARGSALVPPAFGPPVCVVPEWRMIVWAFPNDPSLPGLAHLQDRSLLLNLLRRAPPRLALTSDQSVEAVESELVKYVPGRRGGFRCRLTLKPAGTHTVFAKAYRHPAGDRAFAIQRAVWESEPRRRGDLRIPEPLGYDDPLSVVWQSSLPGEPLHRARDPRRMARLAGRAGANLAGLHEVPLELPRERTRAAKLAELRSKAAPLDDSRPGAGMRAGRLVDQLGETARQLPPETSGTLHGSFKLSHVLAHGDEVALIDLDGATSGDPAYDLGRFVAHVWKLRLKGRLEAGDAERVTRRLLAGYRSRARTPVPGMAVRWFAAAHLVGSQAYKELKRGQLTLADPMLETAAHLLEGIEPHAAGQES